MRTFPAAVALLLVGSFVGCTSETVVAGNGTDSSNPPATKTPGNLPDENTGGPDASTPSAARCDKTKPFGRPAELAEMADLSGDFYFASGVWLDAKETTMLITARPGFDDGGKLYSMTRASNSGAFAAPVLLAGVDVEKRSEWSGAMSSDGLSLYFDVARREPYKATRTKVGDPWTAGERIAPKLSTEFTSYVNVRGATSGLYFLRQGSSGGSYLAYLANGEDYDKPILDAPGDVAGYSLSSDERTLYYSIGTSKIGGNKQYRATRTNLSEPFKEFTEFTLEAAVSSSNGGSRISWVSDDECVLYAVAGKNDQSGSYPHDVIIRATRP